MDRNSLITGILPFIPVSVHKQDSPVEVFMHKTLRPILKFQNRVILELIEQSTHFKNLKWTSGEDLENRRVLSSFVQTNTSLKNQLIGVIVGLIRDHDLDLYFKNRKELNKRILELCVTRYVSQQVL